MEVDKTSFRFSTEGQLLSFDVIKDVFGKSRAEACSNNPDTQMGVPKIGDPNIVP